MLNTNLIRSGALSVGLLFSYTSFASGDFEACRAMFAGGQPPVAHVEKGRAICFDNFAVMHSGKTKTPAYVAERLNKSILGDAKGEERTDRFYEEARIPSADRATLGDYKGSGYDRGHMSPAADQPNPNAMAQSFSLSNMVPQAPQHNRKLWAMIEKNTRQYVMRAQGDVYVITGPVFDGAKGTNNTIGDGVSVPEHLFKLVYDATTGRSWAYWSVNSNDERMSAPISYEELVVKTGINFLPALKAQAAAPVQESAVAPSRLQRQTQAHAKETQTVSASIYN